MQKELEQIIKDYNLEGTRIQVGRQRIYPQREGLNATPEQLENLKSVLEGNSVNGTLRITAGDVVVAANTAGAIEKAFDSGLLPNQPKSSEVNLMQSTTSTTEAPTIEVKSAAPAMETGAKAPVMESQTEIPLMQNEAEVPVLETKAEVPTVEATSEASALDEQLLPPEMLGAFEQRQAKNEAARETYFELLKQHPDFKYLGIETHEELLNRPITIQQGSDRNVLEMALEKGLSPEDLGQVIAQGSPFVSNEREKGSLMAVQSYLTERAEVYQHRLDSQVSLHKPSDGASENIQTATEQSQPQSYHSDTPISQNSFESMHTNLDEMGVNLDRMEVLIEQLNPDSNVIDVKARFEAGTQDQETSLDNVEVDTQPEQVISTATASAEAKQFDFPATAHSIDPAKDFRDTVQRGAVTLKTQAVSAKETLELAQKNLTTFAKHVKHRGFKAWAKDQLPILQNKAKELVQAQATKLSDYAKEQAPILKDAAITGAKQVTQTVVHYAKENAPILAEKAKEFGGTVVERVAEYSRLVDPSRVEALGARVLGKDGGFEGNTFDFRRTENGGIEISLKNGTPVYANGKLNPKLDGSCIYQLNQLAQKVEEFKQTPQAEPKRKAMSR